MSDSHEKKQKESIVGHGWNSHLLALADSLNNISSYVQKLRWRLRLRTGFDPRTVSIPKRFLEIETWKGRIDAAYLNALKGAYSESILAIARDN